MVNLKEETYTGKPLQEMSLAEKELELAKDWAWLQGLRRGFIWNFAHIDPGYALKITAEKVKLGLQGKLDDTITSYERQIAEDKNAIAQDKEALESDGYRGVRLSDKVQSVLDKLTTSEDPENIKDTLMYVKLKMKELETEKRKYELDEKHPDWSVGRLGGKVKNFFADHMSIIAPVSLALTLGGGSWYGATAYFEHQNKNRPTHLVTSLVHPESESIEEEHPGVEAAIAVNDSAMAGNKEVNEFLNSSATNYKSEELSDLVLPLVKKAKERIGIAKDYYSKKGSGISEVVSGGSSIGSAWNHSSYESGHHEARTRTTTDSDGKTKTETYYVYVCDYVDHTWTFNPESAHRGIAIFESGIAILDIPEMIGVTALQARVRAALEKDPKFKTLTKEEFEEVYNKRTDFLHAVTIEGNNSLVGYLYGIKNSPESGEFAWIKKNVDNRSVFSLVNKDRSHSCGPGNPPESYRRSWAFANYTAETGAQYNTIVTSINTTGAHLGEFERIILDLEKGVVAHNEDKVEDLFDELGEVTIATHDALNPESDYSTLSKGWRIAIPLLLLFGLGTGGGVGGYFLTRMARENRFYRRMGRRGMY